MFDRKLRVTTDKSFKKKRHSAAIDLLSTLPSKIFAAEILNSKQEPSCTVNQHKENYIKDVVVYKGTEEYLRN
jgi:hypothetical protein